MLCFHSYYFCLFFGRLTVWKFKGIRPRKVPWVECCKCFFTLMAHPRPLFPLVFCLFKQKLQILQQINVKNVYTLSSMECWGSNSQSLERPPSPITSRPGPVHCIYLHDLRFTYLHHLRCTYLHHFICTYLHQFICTYLHHFRCIPTSP